MHCLMKFLKVSLKANIDVEKESLFLDVDAFCSLLDTDTKR